MSMCGDSGRKKRQLLCTPAPLTTESLAIGVSAGGAIWSVGIALSEASAQSNDASGSRLHEAEPKAQPLCGIFTMAFAVPLACAQ